VHELSHAAVAKARGLPVRSITLFALGGVAQIEKEASDAKTEFWMGIAGPITSALIGLICFGYCRWNWLDSNPRASVTMGRHVGLARRNQHRPGGLQYDSRVPARRWSGAAGDFIWWITANVSRATRVATAIGQLIGFGFIIVGLFRFFNGAGFAGLWLTFIGWFLLDAALRLTRSSKQSSDCAVYACATLWLRTGQSSMRIPTYKHSLTIILLRSGKRCFIVEEEVASRAW